MRGWPHRSGGAHLTTKETHMPSFITHQPGRILRRARHVLAAFVFTRVGIPVPVLAFLDGESALMPAGWPIISPCPAATSRKTR